MTLTKAELADLLFEKVGLNKREAKDMVEHFFEEIRIALERGDIGPENELAALEHAVDRLADPREERNVLSFYVNERDRTHDRKV